MPKSIQHIVSSLKNTCLFLPRANQLKSTNHSKVYSSVSRAKKLILFFLIASCCFGAKGIPWDENESERWKLLSIDARNKADVKPESVKSILVSDIIHWPPYICEKASLYLTGRATFFHKHLTTKRQRRFLKNLSRIQVSQME